MPETGLDIDIKVDGIDEINKALYKYSQQLGDLTVRKALREASWLFARRARGNAPRKTGRLRRAITVRNSRYNTPRRRPGKIGVYVTVKRGKSRNDPKGAYYAHMMESGFNTRGKSTVFRKEIVERFGSRTGRKTLPGKTDVPGWWYMKRAFDSQRINAVNLFEKLMIRASEIVKRKTGLR